MLQKWSSMLFLIVTAHRYEYLWEDGQKYKRPTKLPAPEYVDALMNWTQGLLDDPVMFPNKIGQYHCIIILGAHIRLRLWGVGVPFPKGFRDTIRTIFRRLFRVYAHLYSNHFDHVCALGIEGMRLSRSASRHKAYGRVGSAS